MSPFASRSLVLAAALLLAAGSARAAEPAAPDSATAAAVKKITDRYALTKTRIAELLERRMKPEPLAATLPNPFYRAPLVSPDAANPEATPDSTVVPPPADTSDEGTLARFAASLKVSGVVVLNSQPHLTINQVLCKVGDVIPIGTKERPVYVSVLRITPEELTLGLNEVQQTIRLKR